MTGFGFFKMRSFEFEQTKRCMWCRKSNFTWHQYIFIRFHLYSLLPHSTFLYKITLLHIVVKHSSKVHCFISFIGTFTLGDLTVHEKWFNCTKNLWIYSSRKIAFSNIYFIDLYIEVAILLFGIWNFNWTKNLHIPLIPIQCMSCNQHDKQPP